MTQTTSRFACNDARHPIQLLPRLQAVQMRTHILPHRPRCRSECVKVLFDRGSVRTLYLLGAAATPLWTLDYVYYGHGFCELTGRNRKPVPGVVTSRYRAVSQEDRTANRFLKSQMRSALKTLVLRGPSNSTVAHLTAQGIVFDTQAKRSGIAIIISSVIIEQWLTINTSQKGVKICSKERHHIYKTARWTYQLWVRNHKLLNNFISTK